MKKIFSKTLSLVIILILVYLLSPSAARAQTPTDDLGLETQAPSSADERMKPLTQDDQQCEAQAGLSSMNNLVNKAGSLPNMISQGLQQQLPQTLSGFMTNQLPQLVQQQLQTVLPSLIQTGLQTQLPGFVNSAIRDLVRGGATSADIQAALPEIIDRGTSQIIPQIIESKLPQILQQNIESQMPGYLAQQFQFQLPGIINQNNFRQRVTSTLNTMISNLQKTQPEIRVSDVQKQEIEQGIMDGIISTATSSVYYDPNLNKISHTASPIISQFVSERLMPLLTPLFGSCSKGASDALNSRINSTLGGLTGSGYDLSGGISGQLFNPIMGSLQAPLGNWAYNLPTSIWESANTFSPSDLLGGEGAFSSQGLYSSGITGDLDDFSANTGSSIINSSDGIGFGAISAETWSGIGDSLGTSLAGGVGGMVGNLVGNIPYVGGMLAPLANAVVEEAVLGLLGIFPKPLGWPVADEGLQMEISQGFQNLGKVEGQIANNTQKNNNQNDQMIKQDQDRNALIQQACTHEQSIRNATLNQEKMEFILKPDAKKANWLGLVNRWNAFRQFLQTGYKTTAAPEGTDGSSQGQPLIRPLKQTIAENQDERKREIVDQIQTKNSGNWAGDQVAQRLQLMNKNNSNASTITKEKYDEISNPETAQQLAQKSTSAYWDSFTGAYAPWNSPAGVLITTYGQQLTSAGEAEQNTREEYLANGGIPNGRVCDNEKIGPDGKKYCPSDATWQTTVPGSVLLSYLNSLNSGVVNMITNNPNYQSDFMNYVDNDYTNQISSLGENPNTNTVVQQTSNAGSDPCPGPEPCPKSGWQADQVSETAISNMMKSGVDNAFSGFSNLGDSSGENGNGNNGGGFQLPDLSDLTNGATQSSTISITLNQTTRDIASGKETTIKWQTNAEMCFADNDWLSGNLADAHIEKKTDDAVETTGQLILQYPAQATVNQEYGITCYESDNGYKHDLITIKND
jgi:hypothetical protein